MAALPAKAGGLVVVALDERGKALASEAFARRIAGWRDGGAQDLAFLIGGADGHAPAVRERADFLLSLGPMTWPHLMVRAMLAEQLYRAQQILAGHPYHRA
jgi:23S rRNA (pseudouridine1915-N3)-methyltransferase